MASISQIHANQHNAQASTGPVTPEGKSAASRNALTFGLYTRHDYVKPEEQDLYRDFRETLLRELAPETLLEQSLATEIVSANWRLHRCASAESELPDLWDDATDKIRRSLERARAAAHSTLHRSLNQLRRLQTDRNTWRECGAPEDLAQPFGLADYKQIIAALNTRDRGHILFAKALKSRQAAEPQEAADLPDAELASICKPAASTPRNAPCPCKSGEKYKRCCGRNAPPVLSPVLSKAA
jgi:hypothetical protein